MLRYEIQAWDTEGFALFKGEVNESLLDAVYNLLLKNPQIHRMIAHDSVSGREVSMIRDTEGETATGHH